MSDQATWLIYDGECPFCSRYVAMTRLQEAVGPVRLIDARKGGPEVEAAQSAGFDLDEGMLLHYRGQYFHGAECLNRLALLSTRSDTFNKICATAFRSPTVARLMYPVLRAGRNTTLRLLSRKPMSTSSR